MYRMESKITFDVAFTTFSCPYAVAPPEKKHWREAIDVILPVV